MSLRTTWSDANKITTAGLAIRYNVEPTKIMVNDGWVAGWLVTRTAAKTYYYFGMTEAAAGQCESAKVAQYTREYWTADAQASTYPGRLPSVKCTASISRSPETNDGYAWKVTIQVNETDSLTTTMAPSSPSSLFSALNSRDYDEGTYSDLLSISSAKYGSAPGIYINYSQGIRDFDIGRLVLQCKADPSDTQWQSLEIIVVSSSEIRSPPWDVFPVGVAVVRLCYGSITSNVAVVTAWT